MQIINTPYEIDKSLTWHEMRQQQTDYESASKIAITGSRHYPNYTRVDTFLKRIQGIPVIVSDFGGVESYVRDVVTKRGDILVYHPRDYETYGGEAESIAQGNVIEGCTWLVAFFDNDEPYVQRYIDYAIRMGKRVYILPTLTETEDDGTLLFQS